MIYFIVQRPCPMNYRHAFVGAPLDCMRGTICGTHGHRLFLMLELFAKNALMKSCTEFCTVGDCSCCI
jgi:hypothetical protein